MKSKIVTTKTKKETQNNEKPIELDSNIKSNRTDMSLTPPTTCTQSLKSLLASYIDFL